MADYERLIDNPAFIEWKVRYEALLEMAHHNGQLAALRFGVIGLFVGAAAGIFIERYL